MSVLKVKKDGEWLDVFGSNSNADTLDGKHASDFATPSQVENKSKVYAQLEQPTEAKDGDTWINLAPHQDGEIHLTGDSAKATTGSKAFQIYSNATGEFITALSIYIADVSVTYSLKIINGQLTVFVNGSKYSADAKYTKVSSLGLSRNSTEKYNSVSKQYWDTRNLTIYVDEQPPIEIKTCKNGQWIPCFEEDHVHTISDIEASTVDNGKIMKVVGGNWVASEMPEVSIDDISVGNLSATTDDNGKFLRVVDGVATWVSVSNAEEASF